MSDKVEVQKDILKELIDYSENIIKGTKDLVDELSVSRKEDTDDLFTLVIRGINWEIEVFNNCEDLINSKKKYVDKSKMSKAVEKLGYVLQEKDDFKIAGILRDDFLPFLEEMKEAAINLA